MTELNLCYEYSPWWSQKGREIPAFTILGEDGERVADTNENMSTERQEEVATLFAASPDLLKTLEAAGNFRWVHDVAITEDIEALRKICLDYAAWWNDKALPIIACAKQRLDRLESETPSQ